MFRGAVLCSAHTIAEGGLVQLSSQRLHAGTVNGGGSTGVVRHGLRKLLLQFTGENTTRGYLQLADTYDVPQCAGIFGACREQLSFTVQGPTINLRTVANAQCSAPESFKLTLTAGRLSLAYLPGSNSASALFCCGRRWHSPNSVSWNSSLAALHCRAGCSQSPFDRNGNQNRTLASVSHVQTKTGT